MDRRHAKGLGSKSLLTKERLKDLEWMARKCRKLQKSRIQPKELVTLFLSFPIHLWIKKNRRTHLLLRDLDSQLLTYVGKLVWEFKIDFQTVSTAFRKFCWFLFSWFCRLDPDGSFIGSISQSKTSSELWKFSMKDPSVPWRYSDPVNFKNASIAFVAMEFPRNVSFSSPEKRDAIF